MLDSDPCVVINNHVSGRFHIFSIRTGADSSCVCVYGRIDLLLSFNTEQEF